MVMDEIIELGMTGFSEYYMEEWESLTDYGSIARYIRDNVQYTEDIFISETQAPRWTMERGKGDCEDIALLFMNVAKVSMGIEMEAVVVDTGRSIEDGGIDFGHVAVRYNGEVIEAQYGLPRDYAVRYFYTYKEVFK